MREVRDRLAVSQEELQRRTGMSRTTISSLENGKQSPHPSTVRRLAEALGVHPERLVDGTEEAPDTATVLVGMIEAREARLQEAIDNDEIDLDTAKSADDLYRDIGEVLSMLSAGRERTELALDGLKATVDASYDAAVRRLTDRRASVEKMGTRLRRGGQQGREAKSA